MQINNPCQQPAVNYNPGYATYQYNPVPNMQRYQQLDTQIQQQFPQFPQTQQVIGINGKIVAAVENITANDVPMDGSVAFFPKQDLSEIYVKHWDNNGKIRTIVFKPLLEADPNNSSTEQEKSKFDPLENVREVFTERFDRLENQINEILAKSTPKTTTSRKKESVENE